VFPSNGPRRVIIAHDQRGSAVVLITRHNDRLMYVFMLAFFTAGFLVFAYVFISPLFRNPLSSKELVLLLPTGFILLWYFLALRIAGWRAFGVEQIVVENGVFMWRRTALFWKRVVLLPAVEISDIRTLTPWHDLSNHVEFRAKGRRNRIGDMLRRDETHELADLLRRVIQLQK
jgi:hypothetical protein